MSWESLQAAAEHLNVATNRLNEGVEKLEAALKKLNLGVPAWVHVRGEALGEIVEVGYDRHEGKWGILIRTWDKVHPEPVTNSFVNSARKLRMEVVDKLPDLMERLAENAETTLAQVQESVATAKAIAEAIAR